MNKLLKSQFFKTWLKPWFLLVLVISVSLIVLNAASPHRGVSSYKAFVDTYGNQKPNVVSAAVLGEARPELSMYDIYEEYMQTKKDLLFAEAHASMAEIVSLLGCILAAFFLGNEIKKNKVKPLLLGGQSRASVFLWLTVRYYLVAFLVMVASFVSIRLFWSVDFRLFPLDFVVSAQLRFLLYGFSIFGYYMLITFLVKNPILSALASLAFFAVASWLCRSIPFSSLRAYLSEASWAADAAPGSFTPSVIAAVVVLLVTITASYLIFRRREVR